MLKVGITGGIGAGKTLISHVFNAMGVPVYNADSRAKWVMTHDEKVKSSIQSLFGKESYTEGGVLNTAYLSKVFSDAEKLQKLNAIVHPAVGQDFLKWTHKYEGCTCILKEAALLYESGSYKLLDKIIVVSAPEQLRIERVLSRDPHRSKAQLQEIINKQMDDAEKIARADFVIDNGENRLVVPQVLEVLSQLNC